MVDFQKVRTVDLATATVEDVSVLTKHSALEASREGLIESHQYSRRWIGPVRFDVARKGYRYVAEKRFKVEEGV